MNEGDRLGREKRMKRKRRGDEYWKRIGKGRG
jgi:hypothetical protein